MKLILATLACALLLQVHARSFVSNLPIQSGKRLLDTPSLANALRGLQNGEVTRLQYLLDMRRSATTGHLNKAGCAYEGYPDTSTMCVFDVSPEATEAGVSAEGIIAIVDAHNNYRSNVNPTAENMQKMMWDENIAVIAQHYALSCPWAHDTNTNRQVPGYGIFIGQNLAWGYGSWDAAIKGWHDEVALMDFGNSGLDISDVGHYTQVVRHESARVGCGYSVCEGWKTYVCNYAYINMNTDYFTPYAAGSTCAQCPDSCNDNLCDCAGKVCLNGGRLDINSCECSCTGIYYGEFCGEGGSDVIPEVPEHDLSGADSATQETAEYEFACPLMQGNGPGGGGPPATDNSADTVEDSSDSGSPGGGGASDSSDSVEDSSNTGGPGGGGPSSSADSGSSGGPGGGGPNSANEPVVTTTTAAPSNGRPRSWKIIA